MHFMLCIPMTFISVALLLTPQSWAVSTLGGMEGGGGKSIVCRNAKGEITSTELLDLYEGRIQYGFSYQESPLPATQQAMNIMINSNLEKDGYVETSVFEWYKNVVRNIRFVPEGTVLNPIDDSLEVVAPKDCAIEQTAYYQNDQNILISSEIWGAMSETQKAALLIHESVYRYLRGHNETNSRRARHFTGYLLSGGKVEVTSIHKDKIQCHGLTPASKTEFSISGPYLNADGREVIKLRFKFIFGRRLLTNSFVELINKESDGLPSLLDLIRNPRENQSGSYHTYTRSPFEGFDQIAINFGKKEEGLSIKGTSSVDNRAHEFGIRCLFYQ